MLGDIFHMGAPPIVYLHFYKLLETLDVEFQIIPGNHDRKLRAPVVAAYRGRNVNPHEDELIVVESDNGSRKVVLGHDRAAHGQTAIRKWFRLLRAGCAHCIPDDALLAVGHVHEYYGSADGLSWCIPPFSVTIGTYAYGVLERSDAGVLQLAVRHISQSGKGNPAALRPPL